MDIRVLVIGCIVDNGSMFRWKLYKIWSWNINVVVMGEFYIREVINNDVINFYMIVGDLFYNYFVIRIECENLVYFLGKIDGLLCCDF